MEDVPGFAHDLSGCEVLFHTAAYFREYFRPGHHDGKLHTINVTGTLQLLEAAEQHHVKKVVYVSTAGVIGLRPEGAPSDETVTPGPLTYRNLYFKSKLLAESKVYEFLQHHSLDVVLILPGVILGPRDAEPTPTGQVVLDYLHGRVLGVLKGGLPLVDVCDVALTMIAAVDKGRTGERYLIGGQYVEMQQILDMLEQVTGIPAPQRHIPDFAARTLAYLMAWGSRITGQLPVISLASVEIILAKGKFDSRKAFNELGILYRPLTDTLRDEVEWYREHGFIHRSELKRRSATTLPIL